MSRARFALLSILLCFGSAHAADSASGGLFDGFRKKVESLTPKKKLQTTTAVGGVRGSQADAGELYWKGEITEQGIDAKELASFEAALSHAENGENELAEKALRSFMKEYPQSQLNGDAEQALALLKGK